MSKPNEKLQKVNAVLHGVIDSWYQRIKEHYVTEEDSQSVGVEPEVKFFHEFGNHRIKFARQDELDVTYGLGVEEQGDRVAIVSSVNNKTEKFDYDQFVERLKTYYWRSRNEKPWTRPRIDHFSYGDLMEFEPKMGKSVMLDLRKEKADIIRLFFKLNPRHEDLLLNETGLLQDLVENYCLYPLRRIYAESYRGS